MTSISNLSIFAIEKKIALLMHNLYYVNMLSANHFKKLQKNEERKWPGCEVMTVTALLNQSRTIHLLFPQ